jgi:hypothetical protein
MRLPQHREICALARSGVLTVLLPAMIRFLPLPRVLSLIEPRKISRDCSLTVGHLAHLAKSVSRRAPRFGVGECLTRSFVLYNLLRRFAYSPILFIGARISEGDLECHSWIEVDGEPLCEFNNPRKNFKVLYLHKEPGL